MTAYGVMKAGAHDRHGRTRSLLYARTSREAEPRTALKRLIANANGFWCGCGTGIRRKSAHSGYSRRGELLDASDHSSNDSVSIS